MRYAYTVYLFGGEPFRAALLDERVDPLLRALGLVPEPAIAERSWRVALPTFQRATGGVSAYYRVTVPPGVFGVDPARALSDCLADARSETERAACRDSVALLNAVDLPNTTDAAEVNTITKIVKVFEGDVPSRPWPTAACVGVSPRLCSGATGSVLSALQTALSATVNGASGDLASRYGFFAMGAPRSNPLTVVAARGGSVLPLLLAAAAGFVYFRSQSGGLGRFGRVPTTIKAGRLRKLARRKWHEGKYAEAKRLERRANQISRSA